MSINKVAVIGAGVMGAGIAAQMSNAGIPVDLLDIVPDHAENRNRIAEQAIEKLLTAKPPPLMHHKNARLITPGNIEDHLPRLADADWVIEAVVENLQIKQALYQRLDAVCRADTLISSNTSTLPLHLLTQGMSKQCRARFMITHFFNPPRYMRLLELVAGPEIRPELLEAVRDFADLRLGKGCVMCKDTPGFIANRIGIYWLQTGVLLAIKLGLTVEEADAVLSAPLGIPKTGIFGLLDLVGLDLLPPILASMDRSLPAGDAFREISTVPPPVLQMIVDGYTGRKGKGGFYRLSEIDGKRVKQSRDLQTGTYQPSEKPQLPGIKQAMQNGPAALLASDDKTGRYAWQVISNTLVYAAGLIPEIADDIAAIDQAMRLGFNWKYGPFELLDRIGGSWFIDRLVHEGRDIPALIAPGLPCYKMAAGKPHFLDLSGNYRPLPEKQDIVVLSDIKARHAPVLDNTSASLWDVGNDVACLEFHSKMNTLDLLTMDCIRQSIERVTQEFAALVIYNDADNFSAGANLRLLTAALGDSNWSEVEKLVTEGQLTFQALKYAPFPVVGAPSGLALGGGCEILLHCDAIQAHAELYIGLVEVGVGLIPGWGGCKEYLRRCLNQPHRPGGPIPPVIKAFETIGRAKVSQSAYEAKDLLFLSASDQITMNKDRLLADAKHKALALSKNYQAPEPAVYTMPGKTARILLNMAAGAFRLLGKASAYDVEVAQQLAYVLSGGHCDITEALTENDILALEREAFLHLVKQAGTVDRLQHMLKTGKPLRN